MLCLEKRRRKKGEGQCEESGRKMEREKERERRGDGVAWRKEIFSAVACIMNEGALCLKLQPGASLQGLLGRVGPCDLTPATLFILPMDAFTWHCGFDPVEKQITSCVCKRNTERERDTEKERER